MRIRLWMLVVLGLMVGAVAVQASEVPADRLSESEKKAMTMARWWEHKFESDPAFKPILPKTYSYSRLPQYSIEEEPR